MNKIIHYHIALYISYSPGWPKVVYKKLKCGFCGLRDTIYVYRKLMKDHSFVF